MSDRASIILGHLGDADVLTVDELVEATGFERSAVSQELVALKAAGQCYSGRGGWRLSPNVIAPAKVRRHEAAEPESDPGRRDAQKTMRMSQVDTARLALALKRWATLIDVREAA